MADFKDPCRKMAFVMEFHVQEVLSGWPITVLDLEAF
jgi:hypothetical protein